MKNSAEQNEQLFEELKKLCKKLKRFYDIDKIKPYAVYVWGKSQAEDMNLFDITADEIVWYVEKKPFIEGSENIISAIQMKLKEIK